MSIRLHPYPGSEEECGLCREKVKDIPHYELTLKMVTRYPKKLATIKHTVDDLRKGFLSEQNQERWLWK